MVDMFEITADQDRQLLWIRMWGFWDAEMMSVYLQEVRRKLRHLQTSKGCRSILIDMTDYPIQSRDVAEGHAANLRVVRDRGEARVALVMQSALSKLQAARVAHDTGHATFPTEQDALAWLMESRL